MQNTVLVTGANGFIGRYIAKEYHDNGYYIVGVGHGKYSIQECKHWGIDEWHEMDITIDVLKRLLIRNIIVHCAGSGSVGFSVTNPMQDFERTVLSTHYVLEYMRLYAPNAKLIYPSSAAIYGCCAEMPIRENALKNPISPYGYHKKWLKIYVECMLDNMGYR